MMAVWPDLEVRDRRAELMDDPALDGVRHRNALRALARINRVSLGAWRLEREIAALHARSATPVRVLDVACGGGDLLIRVALAARRAGRTLVLHGCDRSPEALDFARDAGNAAGLAGASGGDGSESLRFFQVDALHDELPEGYDLVTSSLFLHHLEWSDAVNLLRRMAAAARHRVLVQDLRRTHLGYAFAWVGLHTLTSSDVARVDGLRSVRAAFTLDEVRRLCEEAGLSGADVEGAWPQRFVVRWEHEEAA